MKAYLNLTVLSIFSMIILFALGCKKKSDSGSPLPEATQSGQMTFACYLNGNPWISDIVFPYPNGGIAKDTLFAAGTSTRNLNSVMNCYLSIALANVTPKSGDVYRLNDTTKYWATYWTVNSQCFDHAGQYGSHLAYASDGELHLTRVDTSAHIIAGTFWFDIPTKYCDTIKVTEGRFDFSY